MLKIHCPYDKFGSDGVNLPNILTVFRIFLIPLSTFLILYNTKTTLIYGLIVFCIASITDFLDGWIARKYKLISAFGKFLDPIADKLLILCTLFALTALTVIPAWLGIIILFRDLLVDGLRLVAVEKGEVIVASKLGKIKTIFQMIFVISYLVHCISPLPMLYLNCNTFMVVLFTIWSAIDYFVKNRQVFSKK